MRGVLLVVGHVGLLWPRRASVVDPCDALHRRLPARSRARSRATGSFRAGETSRLFTWCTAVNTSGAQRSARSVANPPAEARGDLVHADRSLDAGRLIWRARGRLSRSERDRLRTRRPRASAASAGPRSETFAGSGRFRGTRQAVAESPHACRRQARPALARGATSGRVAARPSHRPVPCSSRWSTTPTHTRHAEVRHAALGRHVLRHRVWSLPSSGSAASPPARRASPSCSSSRSSSSRWCRSIASVARPGSMSRLGVRARSRDRECRPGERDADDDEVSARRRHAAGGPRARPRGAAVRADDGHRANESLAEPTLEPPGRDFPSPRSSATATLPTEVTAPSIVGGADGSGAPRSACLRRADPVSTGACFLGRRLMAGQRILIPRIGVRIPAPELETPTARSSRKCDAPPGRRLSGVDRGVSTPRRGAATRYSRKQASAASQKSFSLPGCSFQSRPSQLSPARSSPP